MHTCEGGGREGGRKRGKEGGIEGEEEEEEEEEKEKEKKRRGESGAPGRAGSGGDKVGQWEDCPQQGPPLPLGCPHFLSIPCCTSRVELSPACPL